MSDWWGTEACKQVRVLRASGVHVTSRVRCAARYAALTGSTINETAQAFGLQAGGVWAAWGRIYPDVPQPKRFGL
jgi:hypothetical protein